MADRAAPSARTRARRNWPKHRFGPPSAEAMDGEGGAFLVQQDAEQEKCGRATAPGMAARAEPKGLVAWRALDAQVRHRLKLDRSGYAVQPSATQQRPQ